MPYRKPLQWPEKSLSIKSVDVIKEDDYLPSLSGSANWIKSKSNFN